MDRSLLSPEQAALLLTNNPNAAPSILARLDVAACRFSPCVDSGGEPPIIQTQTSGFGDPVTAPLAFSVKAAAKIRTKGKPVILVIDGKELANIRDVIEPSDVFITAYKRAGKSGLFLDHHLVGGASCFGPVLLDRPEAPSLEIDAGKETLRAENGVVLTQGETVTLSPLDGTIWRGTKTILPSPAYAPTLLRHLFPDITKRNAIKIGHHRMGRGSVQKHLDIAHYLELNDRIRAGDKAAIGLHRTEASLRERWPLDGSKLLPLLSNGIIPKRHSSLPWEFGALWTDETTTYRLVDFRCLVELLSKAEKERTGLNSETCHTVGSPSFRFRSALYRFQLRNAAPSSYAAPMTKMKTIVIPFVKNAQEVLHFKRLVQEEAIRMGLEEFIRFAVMIETKEALQNIGEIAPLCDCLCIGTNDLTAELTGLSREGDNHAAWMAARGYTISPFRAFVPEVTEPLAKALQIARSVKPDIFINMCGAQTDGSHIPSIDAALAMGTNQLTVPTSLDHTARAQLAALRYFYRKRLRLG